MTDINLQNGCELWATFDTEDVDSQRGIVRDRSGKGRTLEASGAPTYGQASPVGEAVGFDGTDDEFVANGGSDMGGATKYSLAAVVKWDGGASGNNKDVIHRGTFSMLLYHRSNSTWGALVTDADGVSKISPTNKSKEDEYVTMVAIWDSGKLRSYVDGSLEGVETSFTSSQIENSIPKRRYIGANSNASTRYFSGDVAFVGEWSRVLTDAEINQLNRMTDRMVSRL